MEKKRRKKSIEQPLFTNEYVIWLLKLKTYWKYCGKEEKLQFLLFCTIFCYLLLNFHVKTETRFSLRNKLLFEISEVEITRVDCIKKNCNRRTALKRSTETSTSVCGSGGDERWCRVKLVTIALVLIQLKITNTCMCSVGDGPSTSSVKQYKRTQVITKLQ